MLKSADVHSVVSTHVETIVLLRGVKTDSHISVDLDVEKLCLKTVKLFQGSPVLPKIFLKYGII